MKDVFSNLEKQWNTLNDHQRKIVDAGDEGNDGDDTHSTGGSTVKSLEFQMADVQARQKSISTWGVIVYDIGKHAIHPHFSYELII
jgi:hypothetical protein